MGRALVGLLVLLIAACSGKPAPPSERTATDPDERALGAWFHPRSQGNRIKNCHYLDIFECIF